MQHELSITKAERAAIEAAEERAYAAGVNDCLAWLIEHQQHDTARRMRADFVEPTQHQEPAA